MRSVSFENSNSQQQLSLLSSVERTLKVVEIIWWEILQGEILNHEETMSPQYDVWYFVFIVRSLMYMSLNKISMVSRDFSYLWIDFLEVRVVLVDLEVDLGGRDGHRAVHGYARWHQDGGGADVDRTLN